MNSRMFNGVNVEPFHTIWPRWLVTDHKTIAPALVAQRRSIGWHTAYLLPDLLNLNGILIAGDLAVYDDAVDLLDPLNEFVNRFPEDANDRDRLVVIDTRCLEVVNPSLLVDLDNIVRASIAQAQRYSGFRFVLTGDTIPERLTDVVADLDRF